MGGGVWTGGGWGVLLYASKQWDELSMAYLFATAPTPPDIPVDGRLCLCHRQAHGATALVVRSCRCFVWVLDNFAGGLVGAFPATGWEFHEIDSDMAGLGGDHVAYSIPELLPSDFVSHGIQVHA